MDVDQMPVDGEPDRPKLRLRGLGRYLKRLGTAFKLRRPNKAAKRSPNDHPGDSRPEPPLEVQEPSPPSRPEPPPLQRRPYTFPSDYPRPPALGSLQNQAIPGQSPESRPCSAAAPSLSRSNSNPFAVQDPRAKRAADLFEKYGIDLDPEICPYQNRPASTGRLERVEKPVRMRVHHHCHHCSLAIGPTGVCVNCGHKLCKKCYRFPETRETKTPETKEQKKRKAPSPTRSETLENWLAAPSSSLAFRPSTKASATHSLSAIRRVRRLCHQCSAPFIWTERVCQDCEHEMCSRCPQDPPATAADSYGSAMSSFSPPQVVQRRDRIFKKPRLRVRYSCDQCGSLLQEKTDFCSKCGHLRCQNCKRSPPRREPLPDSDPAQLEALQKRLATCTIPVTSPHLNSTSSVSAF